jgi:cystathionine gamma-synthase
MKIETRLLHAGAEADPVTGAVAPPIVLSTTFARHPDGTPIGGHTYIRESNPTQDRVEAALAAAEGGAAALVFASGMAAGVALLETLPAGSRVLLPDDVYYGYRVAAADLLAQRGVTTEYVAMDDLAALDRALGAGAALVWLETPSNPLLKVTDLRGAAARARAKGATVLVDNTFATPVLQRPLELGADVVLHATTKYIGGHSDVAGGALVFSGRDGLFERTLHVRHIGGAIASPFDSWLVLRGLKTLAVRVRAQCSTAGAVAEALARHPAVSAVHYPGLQSHPGHAVARGQMEGFGAMLSFQLKRGREAALAAVANVRLFTRATSLGGYESLIEHRASSEGVHSTTPQDLVRVSVGLEHADDLIEDLEQALEV